MLLEWRYFQVVLLLANVAQVINKVVNDQKNATETGIFRDVIKNITRVNQVLKELIKNYEQLQKMYRADSFEEDYSSDSEIDEVFRNAKREYKKRVARTHNETYKYYPPTKKSFPGTEMIVSEEDLEGVTEKTDFIDGNNRLPLIQRLQAPDSASTNKIDSEDSSDDIKDINRGHKNHTHSDEVRVPINIFYDSADSNIKITTKKIQPEYDIVEAKDDSIFYNNGRTTNITKHTTEMPTHKVTKARLNNGFNINGMYSTAKAQANARNIQKIVQSESFQQENIWDEIANKKPIALRTQRDRLLEKNRDVKSYAYHLNSRPKKTALVIVTNNNKNLKFKSEEESSMSIREEDKEIDKELFKSSILRVAYGDACSKVVVKKCFKALKEVGKAACRNVKCKSAFKEKYKENSKVGCIAEFTVRNTTQNWSNRADNTFRDATRVGLEDCYPFMKSHAALRNETPRSIVDMEVNILRDRYERACQKASSAKCKTACTFAYTNTCTVYDCSKYKKKTFKRLCKKKCKLAYKSATKKEHKKSSSSSGSGSGSDSDDSDSDSDDSLSISIKVKDKDDDDDSSDDS